MGVLWWWALRVLAIFAKYNWFLQHPLRLWTFQFLGRFWRWSKWCRGFQWFAITLLILFDELLHQNPVLFFNYAQKYFFLAVTPYSLYKTQYFTCLTYISMNEHNFGQMSRMFLLLKLFYKLRTIFIHKNSTSTRQKNIKILNEPEKKCQAKRMLEKKPEKKETKHAIYGQELAIRLYRCCLVVVPCAGPMGS